MKLSALLFACACVSLSACAPGSSDPSVDGTGSETDDLSAKKPIAYVRQFVGVYHSNDAESDVQKIQLRATGTYKLTFANGKTESGVYRGPSKPADPLKIVLLKTGVRRDGVLVNGFGVNPTTLTVTRGKSVTELTLDRPDTADESLCDDSGGSWTDDDADPATGLYCVCDDPSAPYFIPSEGGCVAH